MTLFLCPFFKGFLSVYFIGFRFYKFISARFFIASLPDEKLGEKVILVVEGNSFEIDKAIFSEVSKFQIPKEIVFIDKFVETETNKINRKKTLEKGA